MNATSEVRKKAVWKVLVGLGGAAAIFIYVAYSQYKQITTLIPWGLTVIPLAYFCIGAVELLSGKEFEEVASRWNALPRWLQLISGILVAITGSLAIIYLIWTITNRLR